MSKNYEIFEKKFFQAYYVENIIRLVASERISSNFVPEMVLFPKIYIKIYIFSFDL